MSELQIAHQKVLRALQLCEDYINKISDKTKNTLSFEDWIKNQPEILCTHVGMFIKIHSNKGI